MMLYDFCCCGLKQHFPLLRDNELVVADAPPLAVQPDIRGIAQAVAPVQVIARVDKHVLNVQPAQKIVISQFALSHGFTSPFSYH